MFMHFRTCLAWNAKRIVWSAVLKQNTENHRKTHLSKTCSAVALCVFATKTVFLKKCTLKTAFPTPQLEGCQFLQPFLNPCTTDLLSESESFCLTGFVSVSFDTSHIPSNSLKNNNPLALRDHLHSCNCYIHYILSNSERSVLLPQLFSCFLQDELSVWDTV